MQTLSDSRIGALTGALLVARFGRSERLPAVSRLSAHTVETDVRRASGRERHRQAGRGQSQTARGRDAQTAEADRREHPVEPALPPTSSELHHVSTPMAARRRAGTLHHAGRGAPSHTQGPKVQTHRRSLPRQATPKPLARRCVRAATPPSCSLRTAETRTTCSVEAADVHNSCAAATCALH